MDTIQCSAPGKLQACFSGNLDRETLAIKSGNPLRRRPMKENGVYHMIISDLTSLTGLTPGNAEFLMSCLHRLVKDRGVIILAASPLVGANLINATENYRYTMVFEIPPEMRTDPSRGPVRTHLEYHVFYEAQPIYHPQMTHGHARKIVKASHKERTARKTDPICGSPQKHLGYDSTKRFPRSVQRIDGKTFKGNPDPVLRYEYLIRTFTNRNDVVLDFMTGSVDLLIACLHTRRRFMKFSHGNDRFPDILRGLKAGFAELQAVTV